MSTKTVYQKIPLEKIDIGNKSFSLSHIEDDHIPDHLRESIAKFGIIHPPLVLQTDELYVIITGRKHICAAREVLGQDFCNCLVLPTGTAPKEALSLALEDIRTSREPSPVEEALCWQKAVEIMGEEKARDEFGSKLDITGKLSPDRLMKLPNLEKEILGALHSGEVNLKIANRLMDIDREGRKKLFEIMDDLKLSHSNQRKLIDHCRELHKRHGRSINEILSSQDCREIIEHREANPPQKTTMLMNWFNEQ